MFMPGFSVSHFTNITNEVIWRYAVCFSVDTNFDCQGQALTAGRVKMVVFRVITLCSILTQKTTISFVLYEI